jgi:hypothetical protein
MPQTVIRTIRQSDSRQNISFASQMKVRSIALPIEISSGTSDRDRKRKLKKSEANVTTSPSSIENRAHANLGYF